MLYVPNVLVRSTQSRYYVLLNSFKDTIFRFLSTTFEKKILVFIFFPAFTIVDSCIKMYVMLKYY